MQRAVIYCRCSTEEESQKDALKKQTQEAKDAVEAQGWELAGVYVEAKSGTSVKNRTQYLRLYEALSDNSFEIVVIKSQDRLMRNTRDWYLFIDRLVCNQKRLYFYLEHKFYSSEDALLTGIKAILAEEYSRELSQKMNHAHKNRQLQGEAFILPPGTYGLRRSSGHQYELVEKEAVVIQRIFSLAKDFGCGKIAERLTAEGVKNRNGKAFEPETIRKIIRNPIRCGTVVQNRRHYDFQQKKTVWLPKEEWVIHQNAVPACVSEEVWREANRAMDLRASKHCKT